MTKRHPRVRVGLALFAALVASCALAVGALAQSSPSAAPGESLDAIEARLADRYDRLELLSARLAELSGATQPRRAELLRQLVETGRERDVAGQFDDVVAALREESYSSAVDGQARLQGDLEKLLDLLLQEDRDRRLDSERKRVLRYLQDLNRLIRLQRGVKARTGGGDDAAQLAADQQRVGENTEELQQQIEDDEATARPKDPGDESKSPEGDPQSGEPQASPPGDEGGSESQPSDGQQSDEQQPGGQQSGEQQSGDQQSGEQQSGESGSGESPGRPQPSDDQRSPMERTAERLKRAQQRMQEAQERLEDSRREGAVDEQERAIEELEQAKAELERILRQLREEELERMLVLLEARFRKMLDDQIEVYEETKQVDGAQASAPAHEIEIAAGRLSRREKLIVREADRALVLLREDGTSVAFPEAVEQARDDMQQITDRLGEAHVDELTQIMERDVIESLEEILTTLREQLDELRDQKSQQQQSGQSGAPGEQPLVDRLAELRMIRALQLRVNRRTEQYGALIEGEQARETEVLEMLDELSLRQSKIAEATHDVETGANR